MRDKVVEDDIYQIKAERGKGGNGEGGSCQTGRRQTTEKIEQDKISSVGNFFFVFCLFSFFF